MENDGSSTSERPRVLPLVSSNLKEIITQTIIYACDPLSRNGFEIVIDTVKEVHKMQFDLMFESGM